MSDSQPRKTGFFRSLFRRRIAEPAATPRVPPEGVPVTVAFLPLTERIAVGAESSMRGYTYRWTLPTSPAVGTRVMVEASGDLAPAIIIATEAEPGWEDARVRAITRVATAEDFNAARISGPSPSEQWLTMMRHAAGLPTVGNVATEVPDGFPSIPPTSGDADRLDADIYGNAWWRAYKAAQERGWPDYDISVLHRLGMRWYAVRDGTFDEGVERKRRARIEAKRAGEVRGRHFVEWVPTLNEWRGDRARDDESLALLLEIIDATERAHDIYPTGGMPPAYTKRAAIIYRRRKDYAAEVAICDRYLARERSEDILKRRDAAAAKLGPQA